MFEDMFGYLSIGMATALSPPNLMFCFIGVLIGTIVGVLPGIGPLAAMSMLFPLTFHIDPTSSLIMLAGIWYGTTYGGSTAAILLNVPGTTSAAVTSLDGYPMSRQGRAGVALFMTAVASFIGGSLGILLMMVLSPVVVAYALRFGPPEYFSLILMGFIAASTISQGSPVKSIAMVAFGVFLGVVGLDVNSGQERFTFGMLDLLDGISLIALAMGLFGIAEVINTAHGFEGEPIRARDITFRSMLPTADDRRRSKGPILRGAAVGSFFGTLPGTGPAIAAFVAYAVEKRIARDPSRFGNGAIEGVVAPESANNAADQTAFIPTMTLGIPGSATMALMLGALMIQGISPGPGLMTEHPELFWGLVMSFWVGNVMLLVLNIPLIGLWVRLLTVPYHILYPTILMFIAIGVFTVNYSSFDIWMVVLFGVLGYLMRLGGLPAAPMLLGYVLGPMMEEQFRRSLLIARGDLMTFVHHPISATILVLTAMILLFGLYRYYRNPTAAEDA